MATGAIILLRFMIISFSTDGFDSKFVLKTSALSPFYANGKLPENLSVNDWFFSVNTFGTIIASKARFPSPVESPAYLL